MRCVSSVVYADVALDLRPVDLLGQERERRGLGIAGLRLELRPVDGAAVQPRRRAGLQARPLQAQGPQLIAQQLRRRLAVAAAAVLSSRRRGPGR